VRISFVRQRATVGTAEVLSGSNPSSKAITSLSEVSNLCRRFGKGWLDTGNSSGQTVIKSPPGPNLHSGPICSFKRLFILSPVLHTDNYSTDKTHNTHSKYFYR